MVVLSTHRPPAEIHVAVELPVDHSQEVDDRCVLLGGVAAAPGQPAPGAPPALRAVELLGHRPDRVQQLALFGVVQTHQEALPAVLVDQFRMRQILADPRPEGRRAARPPREITLPPARQGATACRVVYLAPPDLDQDGGHERVAIDLLARPVPSAAVGFGLDSGEVAVAVPQAVVLAGSGVPGELVRDQVDGARPAESERTCSPDRDDRPGRPQHG